MLRLSMLVHLDHLEHLTAVAVLWSLGSFVTSNPVDDGKRSSINHDDRTEDTKRDVGNLLKAAASDTSVVKHWLC